MTKQPTVIKITGEYTPVKEARDAILAILYVTRSSPVIESGQGGCHAFITVEGVKK